MKSCGFFTIHSYYEHHRNAEISNKVLNVQMIQCRKNHMTESYRSSFNGLVTLIESKRGVINIHNDQIMKKCDEISNKLLF